LQFVHQLGLAGCRLKVLAAHDADADTSANSAQTNDETGSECNKAEYVFHLKLLRIKFMVKEKGKGNAIKTG
jgi:hypothetical protein